MPIDFPFSPTTGQVYTYEGKSWVYNGTGWDSPRALSEIGAVQTFANSAARTAAIPTPTEGIVSYLNDVDRLDVYSGSAHVPAAGLTFIKEQIVGTNVPAVTITEAFNSTYDDYLIFISGGSGGGNLSLQLGSTTTGYYAGGYINFYGGTFNGEAQSNGGAFTRVGRASSVGSVGTIQVCQPFAARRTFVSYTGAVLETGGFAWSGSGFLNDNNSYSSFTLTPNVGTLTGLSIKIYGYRKP
jgi:hypothetical protein